MIVRVEFEGRFCALVKSAIIWSTRLFPKRKKPFLKCKVKSFRSKKILYLTKLSNYISMLLTKFVFTKFASMRLKTYIEVKQGT